MIPAYRLGMPLLALGVLPLANPVAAQDARVRIIQTNAAGDNVHIIDPATNEVVGVISGIPIPHGVTSHPDGSEYYFSNEVDHTLDVVSTQTLAVIAQIPLTDRPNNVAITPDGSKVYIAIAGAAFVDVIDVRARRNVRSIPTDGGVHNVYVTPDGKHMVAGMIGARSMAVFETETDEHVWSMEFDNGVRPMAFERGPDGSQLWSTSKPNSHLYAWSLPDLEYLGGVAVGHHPDWLTMTPDSRFIYSANAGSNDVSAVDTQTLREVARIPVGQVPKRNHTAILPGGSR